jgi:hypothetical protein
MVVTTVHNHRLLTLAAITGLRFQSRQGLSQPEGPS